MSTRVYVGGLNHRSREKDIERFFRKFGRIREISLKVNIIAYLFPGQANDRSARGLRNFLEISPFPLKYDMIH